MIENIILVFVILVVICFVSLFFYQMYMSWSCTQYKYSRAEFLDSSVYCIRRVYKDGEIVIDAILLDELR